MQRVAFVSAFFRSFHPQSSSSLEDGLPSMPVVAGNTLAENLSRLELSNTTRGNLDANHAVAVLQRIFGIQGYPLGHPMVLQVARQTSGQRSTRGRPRKPDPPSPDDLDVARGKRCCEPRDQVRRVIPTREAPESRAYSSPRVL